MFKHYSHRPRLATSNSYYATDIAKLYNFPAGDGSGQTIGIIELGGGYTLTDLHTYASKLGLPPVNITTVEVDGGKNDPTDASGASDEVLLDIEIIYAIAPRAKLRVYFCPNTDQGFVDGINQAVKDKCNILSVSWGSSEKQWNSSSIIMFEKAFENAAKASVTVLCASGDSGADDDDGDGLKDIDVDYPASSQWVLACGGTQITSTDEIVWNNLAEGEGATGAGMSSLFVRPSWQTRDKIDKPNRCVPDIVANASPLSGYNILVNGSWQIISGTSAVSPLYAGLIARLNQILGKNIGYANPVLYALNNRSYKDIINGDNGYWLSGNFFDLASGLGRLSGTHLLEDIRWVMNNV